MYQRILVPVDGSSTAQRGLDEAIALARLTHGRVRVLHVIDELSLPAALDPALALSLNWLGSLRDAGAKVLDEAGARARAEGVEVETVAVDNFKRPLCAVVAEEAARWPADLIVLGSHGRRGTERVLLGSDAERIVRQAAVPVLLVHAAHADDAAAAPSTAAQGA